MAEIVVVDAVLKEKTYMANGDDYRIALDIKEFKSKYPTNVYGCPLESGEKLKEGKSYMIKLLRTGLQQKYADATSPAPWMYVYRWEDGPVSDAPTPVHTPGAQDDFRRSKEEMRRTEAANLALKACEIFGTGQQSLTTWWRYFDHHVFAGLPEEEVESKPKPKAKAKTKEAAPPVEVDEETDDEF